MWGANITVKHCLSNSLIPNVKADGPNNLSLDVQNSVVFLWGVPNDDAFFTITLSAPGYTTSTYTAQRAAAEAENGTANVTTCLWPIQPQPQPGGGGVPVPVPPPTPPRVSAYSSQAKPKDYIAGSFAITPLSIDVVWSRFMNPSPGEAYDELELKWALEGGAETSINGLPLPPMGGQHELTFVAIHHPAVDPANYTVRMRGRIGNSYSDWTVRTVSAHNTNSARWFFEPYGVDIASGIGVFRDNGASTSLRELMQLD